MKSSSPFSHECIVIGGGPAGLTAALYLRRCHRNVLVIDKGSSRVWLAPRIRNLIGHPGGLPGRVLLKRLRRQAELFGTPIVNGEATVRRLRKGFSVETATASYTAPFVILATGIQDRQPALGNIKDLCRKGLIAYCPICDAFEHTGEKIGVLIDSKAGFGKARFLSRFTDRLHVIAIRAFPIAARTRRAMEKLGARILQGPLEALTPDPRRAGVLVKLRGQRTLPMRIVYVELGLKVPHEAVRHLHGLKTTKGGRFLMTRHQQTSIPGLYVAGDCTNSLAQVSVAVGEAAIAATDVHNQLRKSD